MEDFFKVPGLLRTSLLGVLGFRVIREYTYVGIMWRVYSLIPHQPPVSKAAAGFWDSFHWGGIWDLDIFFLVGLRRTLYIVLRTTTKVGAEISGSDYHMLSLATRGACCPYAFMVFCSLCA